MIQTLRFHWYDSISREGVFKDAETCEQVYVNFELCERSHKAALRWMKGQYLKGNNIAGIVNEAWELTNNEGASNENTN